MTQKTFSDVKPDGLVDGWHVDRLWELAKTMPVKRVRLEQITDFDLVTWFDATRRPTSRAVAVHARRIQDVTFDHPIILAADGGVMDGMHRVAKAWLMGLDDIEAVQFDVGPPPDERVLPSKNELHKS